MSGNIYHIVRSHTDDPPADSIPPEVLVPALAEELATYNAIKRDATMRWSWVRIAEREQLTRFAVCGRFYVSEKVMGIIDPPRLQEWRQRGTPEEPPAYLVDRWEYVSSNCQTARRRGRKEVLGEVVGFEFELPEGIVED